VESAPPGGPARSEEDVALTLTSGQYDSFIVRVFSRGPARGLIHGRVTHVATRRTISFTDLQRVMSFILAHVGQSPAPDAPSDGEDGAA
jgi:hypothetical protein